MHISPTKAAPAQGLAIPDVLSTLDHSWNSGISMHRGTFPLFFMCKRGLGELLQLWIRTYRSEKWYLNKGKRALLWNWPVAYSCLISGARCLNFRRNLAVTCPYWVPYRTSLSLLLEGVLWEPGLLEHFMSTASAQIKDLTPSSSSLMWNHLQGESSGRPAGTGSGPWWTLMLGSWEQSRAPIARPSGNMEQ